MQTTNPTNVLIRRNSRLTVRRGNQVLSPSCQSQCSAKLFMPPYFIYGYIFPCHLKVRKKPVLLAETELPKRFNAGSAAFISHTGWEGCGMWGSYAADRLYHLYIYSHDHVEIAKLSLSLSLFLIFKTFVQLSEKILEVGQICM